MPINEGAQTRQAIVAAVGPDVESIDPGDKVLFPRDAGFEVRLARSAHRVRVLRREDLLARIHDYTAREEHPLSRMLLRHEEGAIRRWIELPPR